MIAHITDKADGFELRIAYRPDMVEALKLAVPPSARSWNKTRRCWIVENRHRVAVVALLSRRGYLIETERESGGTTSSNRPAIPWAQAMFLALPEGLHEPVFRALTKVLHPDRGGDLAAMQDLNRARDGR